LFHKSYLEVAHNWNVERELLMIPSKAYSMCFDILVCFVSLKPKKEKEIREKEK